MKLTHTFAAISLCALWTAGCITHNETVYRDVPRAKVEFENEKAGRTFYEALSKMPRKNPGESHTKFSIPVVLNHSETVVTSDNVIFNDAVRRCGRSGAVPASAGWRAIKPASAKSRMNS